MRRSFLATGALLLCICCAEPPPIAPPTPRPPPIDCVAVLGMIPATLAQAPLAAMPYSGVPRDQLISQLSDEELGRLCDYDVCLRANGYLRNCYPYSHVPGDTRFQLETIPLLADSVFTCDPNPNPDDGSDDVTWLTHDTCIQIYRDTFGRCNAGVWEDCLREGAASVVGSHWAPDCQEERRECPID